VKIKELAIAFVLILAYVFISRIVLMQAIVFFSVLSMMQPTNQILLYVMVIVIGLVFGILFKFLSKKFLHNFVFSHFLILSIIFVITGSLVTYQVLSPLISFLEASTKEVTVGEVVVTEKPAQQTYLYLFIIYSISFVITYNIFKRKKK